MEGDAGSEELLRLNEDAVGVSQKEPSFGPYEGFLDEDVLGEPDLADYFTQWENLSDASVIAICRTYANYLAAKTRPMKYKRARTEVFNTGIKAGFLPSTGEEL